MKKAIASMILLACAIAIFAGIYINRSYYAMGGEIAIVGKQENGNKYYIIVVQGTPDHAGWAQFTLECTKDQYDSVDVNDIVGCERYQSGLTHKGTVHKIRD